MSTARQSRNKRNRNISRKDAKARSKKPKTFENLAFLASLRFASGHAWREEYANPRVSDSCKICASYENSQLQYEGIKPPKERRDHGKH